ncbi:MAG TPA: PAS domain S-box protein [Rubrobacteraceae bacterium]|nr:PAS domain S-box protein [Rubrobacteraceae bacterium]
MSDLTFRPQDLGIGHLFERVRDAIIVADAHTGRILLWNLAATEIFGYSVTEAQEMNVEELVPERLRARHRTGLARYRETGHGPYIDSNELLELPAVRKTGEEISVEMSLSPIEPIRDLGDGQRRYVLAVVRDITERKRTEEALRESEARFHALVQNALDIVMVTDAQGTVRYISPSIERVLGYRPEEMVGTNTAAYIHPDDLERALGELSGAASRPGVHPVAVETRVRHKDGSWRNLEGIANNLLDDPVVGGIVFNHRDVTERKGAEEEVKRLNEELENRVKERTARLEAALAELRASEERHRLLVDNVEDYAIFMLDPEGHVLDWNVGAERIFGYKEEAIVGEPGSILFTPEDIRGGAPERELRKAEEEGRALDERWHTRKDGSRFWASGFVRPVRDDAGNLRGFAKVARDITEHRKAEQALSQSEVRYRAVVKQSTDGIYLVDGDTKRILETNPALQNMLGYTAGELNGMKLHEIVAHDRKDVEANIERTLREGTRFIRERGYRRKDGSVVDVEVVASTIYYGGKQVICAAIRDITERKRAEEAMHEVREAERQRIARDLHDGVLQDLSYTTAALGLVMLDAEGTGLERELQGAIDALRRAAEGLRIAVNDLRVAEERGRPFSELVEALVERNREMARGYEIGLEVEEGFPTTSFGDAGTEMLRVLQEALTNARRHSEASNVKVTLSKDGDELVAEVADDGRGFGPGTAGGMGFRNMGERAAALGGNLKVESSVGQGTRVRLRAAMPQEG